MSDTKRPQLTKPQLRFLLRVEANKYRREGSDWQVARNLRDKGLIVLIPYPTISLTDAGREYLHPRA